MMRLARAAWIMLSLVACSRAGEEQHGARRSPSPPPPQIAELPEALDIPVTVDGSPAAAVTAARLAELSPDFADEERRAWKLGRLITAFVPGTAIEAVSREGVAVTMRWPASEAELQPVLFVTRRGDIVATLVDPAEPFPEFHGQGGRLRRPGDTTPRVSPVVRFDVLTTGARAGGAGGAAPAPAPR